MDRLSSRCLGLWLALALAALPGILGAQRLSLQECRDMALATNAKLRTASNAVDAAEETRREAFTKYFPEVSASGMAFRANRNIIEFGILDLVTVSFLRTGHVAGIQFVQPLFMGGQIYNGNRLAEIGVAVAELQRQQSRNDVIETVDKYYWQISALRAKQSTLASATVTVDSLLYNVQAALDAGVVTLNDVLEVKLKRSQLTADSVDLANGLSLCRMLLAQYIGQGLAEVDVDTRPASDVPADPIDSWREPSACVSATADYQMLQKGVEAAELRRKIELGKNLPMVAAGGGYFHENALDASHGFLAAALTVSVPISGWWGGTHAMRKAKIEARDAKLRLDNDTELLQLKMRSAWDDLTAARRKAAIAKESIGQALENLGIYQAMYEAGTTTITDLLDAQTLHRRACDDLTEAVAMYQVKLTQYLIATAQI